jgi:hypothetical protein
MTVIFSEPDGDVSSLAALHLEGAAVFGEEFFSSTLLPDPWIDFRGAAQSLAAFSEFSGQALPGLLRRARRLGPAWLGLIPITGWRVALACSCGPRAASP